jgi:hypothetical protein
MQHKELLVIVAGTSWLNKIVMQYTKGTNRAAGEGVPPQL